MRSAVCQALKDVAYAPGTRSRENLGPIRAQSRHRRFYLGIRWYRVGSYKDFSVLDHLVPDTCVCPDRSVTTTLVLPKAGGSESQRSRHNGYSALS
jgi:hypothetical protein